MIIKPITAEKKIGFFGCKSTTRECMDRFLQDGGKIDYLVTVPPDHSDVHNISGYEDLRSFAEELGITYYPVKTYSLRSSTDIQTIQEYKLDIAFVIGWQRLLPNEVLESIESGAYGMHGSHANLPIGRGRSPMNWALLLGKKEFYTNLFQYQNNVDGGDVVATHRFEITEFDTCATLHHKNRRAMNVLIKNHIHDLLERKISLQQQPEEQATYFPKRIPQDGAIDWNISAQHIYNHVRAQTKPFPGAFTRYQQQYISIWKVIPFDLEESTPPSFVPGEILSLFANGDFVVQTGKGTILVQEYSAQTQFSPHIGMVLESVPFEEMYADIETRYHDDQKNKEITVENMKVLYAQ